MFPRSNLMSHDTPSPRHLPARLPRYLRPARHRRGWRRDRGEGRPRPSDHGRRAVHEGVALHRAHLSPDRLLHPMRRVGKKGEGKFERISWDEALDEIAARLKPIAATRSASDPALQLLRHDGPGAGRVDVVALLQQARRLAAGPHHLRHGRRRPATTTRSAPRSAPTSNSSRMPS